MKKTDFTNVDSILSSVLNLVNIPKPPDPSLPIPLILLSSIRPGLSAQKMGAEVIKRRAEAGLPVGNLPDGQVNPNELLEIIRFQVLIDALASEARISVAIEPGITLTAQGTAAGTPVVVAGVTTTPGIGSAIIQ
jgi:hypothetical protein